MYIVRTNVNNFCDSLNLERTRNIRNTDKSQYNCGGYALETFNWFIPHPNFARYKNDEDNTRVCVESMLADIPNLRIINDVSELKENEYAFAFRVGDGDFHFIKRANNGHWFHKAGASYFIRTMKTEDVFNTFWSGRYNGPITLFAKLREN